MPFGCMSICPTVGSPGPSRIKRGCCKCDKSAFATAPFPWQQSGRSRSPAILRSDVLPVLFPYSSVSTERLRAAILTSTGRHHNAYTVSEVLWRICGCAAKSIRMAARSLRCLKMKNCVVSEWQRLTKPPRCATIFQRSSGVFASISPTSCPAFSGGCPAARRHHSFCSAGEAMAKARQASGLCRRASANPVGICRSSFILGLLSRHSCLAGASDGIATERRPRRVCTANSIGILPLCHNRKDSPQDDQPLRSGSSTAMRHPPAYKSRHLTENNNKQEKQK